MFYTMKSLKSKKFQNALTKLIRLVTQPPVFTVTICLILSFRVSDERILQLVEDDLLGDSLISFLTSEFSLSNNVRTCIYFHWGMIGCVHCIRNLIV